LKLFVSGIMFTEGQFWQEQRRFIVRHLKDLGFGKTSVEDMMMDEIHQVLNEIATTAEADPARIVDFRRKFNIPVINLLWAIVGGERFRQDDETLNNLLYTLETIFRTGNVVRIAIPVPAFLLRKFPKLQNFVGYQSDQVKELTDYFEVIKKIYIT
jgi:methyl farnesoate epoxidase / farnesoate epoxidase